MDQNNRDNQPQGVDQAGADDPRALEPLDGLDPDHLSTLSVEPPERASLIPWCRKDWRPADTTVTLTEARFVSGIVRGPNHRHPAGHGDGTALSISWPDAWKSRSAWLPTSSAWRPAATTSC